MKRRIALLTAATLLLTTPASILYAAESADVIIAEDETVTETDETEAFVLSMEDVPTVVSNDETEEETDDGIIANGTCGDNLTWILSDDGTLTICGTGAMYDICPWEEYDGTITSVIIESGVTTIGDYAFCDCDVLSTVDIPQSVISIGAFAFCQCYNLSAITIPDGVTSIETWAFGSCSSLTSVVIPNSVTTIGDFAFGQCYGLTSVSISEGVVSIGEEAFYNCFNLTSITIPNGVISIGEKAFYACNGLSSITIPTSVTTIGDDLLGYVRSLKEITYLGTIDQWNAIDGSSLAALQYLPIVCSDGTITRDITINEINTDANSDWASLTRYFTGVERTLSITIDNDYFSLEEDVDFTVSYVNNINAGTATATITGIGNYTGSVTIEFEIYPFSIVNCSATLSSSNYTYDGTSKTPTVILTYGSTILVQDVDYTVSYTDNTEIGTATATITGIGNYKGTVYRMFVIEESTETESQNQTESSNTSGSSSTPQTETETETETESETEVASDTTLTLGNDGNWYYTENGETNTSYNGIVEYNGGSFFVANGILCSDANGLNLYDGKWYFLAYGQVQTQHTGLALYDGEWFYITNGVLDTTVNGLKTYDGEQFLFSGGRLVFEYSGLWLNSASIGGDGKWYFIGAGMLQDVSQVVMYDGEWFVVSNGVLATWLNGTIDYDGSTFKVVEGQLYS